MQKTPNFTTGKTDSISISVGELVAENAVMVFGERGCCMCHVVKLLLLGLGVVGELLKISDEEEIEFPVVYVGGKFFGGLERVVATHVGSPVEGS